MSSSNPEIGAALGDELPLIRRALRELGTMRATVESGHRALKGYQLHGELHRGGQGVVYDATQQGTNRRVAVKFLHAGPLVGERDRVRFQREVEILGSLRHPNVVTVHDSGWADGCAFLVMDLIDGPTLDERVRTLRKESADRPRFASGGARVPAILHLFTKVCDAVQAAHLKGIIHRDLKPSNIRIDASGEPQVLDFGLARTALASDDGSSAALLTETGQFVGTIAYASPEQAAGDPRAIDVRTDIYSLGVILYELLSGQLPYDARGGLNELRDQILKEVPARLSTLTHDIPRDVETIVSKCLHKERERRYQTAGELAADIRRYLSGEPIEARRDSSIYLLRMFVRRNRAVALVALSFVALLAASSITLAYMVAHQVELRKLAQTSEARALFNEEVANRRADETRQVAEFQAAQLSGIDVALMGQRLHDDLLNDARAVVRAAGGDDGETAGRLAPFEKVLKDINFTSLALETLEENIFRRAAAAIDEQFATQPLVRAELLQTLASTARNLGLFELALPPQSKAIAIRREFLGEEDARTMASVNEKGMLCKAMGRFDEARECYEEALATSRRLLGEDDRQTLVYLNNLGSLLHSMELLDDALACYTAVLESGRRVLAEDDELRLAAISNVGSMLLSRGRYEEALPYYQEVIDIERKTLGAEHPNALRSLNNMGALLKMMGRLEEALPYFQTVLDVRRRQLGDDHPATLQSISNLGVLLKSMQRYGEALPLYREALETRRRILGDEHPSTLNSIGNMSVLLKSMGRFEEAMPYYVEVLEARRRLAGNKHPATLTSINNMGVLLKIMERYEEALPYYREALDGRRQVLGDTHPDTIQTINNLGLLLISMGRLAEAETLLLEAEAGLDKLPLQHPNQAAVRQSLVDLYEAWHTAEPGSGHDATAASCRSRIASHRAIANQGPAAESP